MLHRLLLRYLFNLTMYLLDSCYENKSKENICLSEKYNMLSEVGCQACPIRYEREAFVSQISLAFFALY